MTVHVKSPVVPPRTDRRFFTGLAVAVALSVFAGFAPTYYLKGLYGTPMLSPLLHLHGLLFTSWILLFVTQTTLVAARRTDLHRRLGIVGGVMAVAMLGVGTAVAVAAAKRGQVQGDPPPLESLATQSAVWLFLRCWWRSVPHRSQSTKSRIVLPGRCYHRASLGVAARDRA